MSILFQPLHRQVGQNSVYELQLFIESGDPGLCEWECDWSKQETDYHLWRGAQHWVVGGVTI